MDLETDLKVARIEEYVKMGVLLDKIKNSERFKTYFFREDRAQEVSCAFANHVFENVSELTKEEADSMRSFFQHESNEIIESLLKNIEVKS